MLNESGMTLVEVLISLLIASSLSLQLLHHNWQLSQQFNQLLLHSDEYFQQVNDIEKMLFSIDDSLENTTNDLSVRINDEA